MSNKNKLKKICGENLSKFISLNFNPEHILPKIEKIFNNNGHDIRYIKESEYAVLKVMLNQESEDKKVKTEKSPQELLSEVGYTLYRCPTFASFSKFKKYYKNGELLCKFNDSGRATSSHVFWIVKDNAKDIERSQNPSRQDDYGTSVCSISVSLDGRNVIQICNRYNHTVSGCDNTFNSNLDNIVNGLTDAFNKEFGFKINAKNNRFEFENFVFRGDTYFYYSDEINGVKIGNYCTIGNEVKRFNKDHYYQWGNYFINLQEKKIIWDEVALGGSDGFVSYFNDTVKKIVFVKDHTEVDDLGSDEVCYIER
jgi:hypothetical protein